MAEVFLFRNPAPESLRPSAPSELPPIVRGGIDMQLYPADPDAPPPSEPVLNADQVVLGGLGASAPPLDPHRPSPAVLPAQVVSIGSLAVTFAGGGAPLVPGDNFIAPINERRGAWPADQGPAPTVGNEMPGNASVSFSRSMESRAETTFIPPPLPSWGPPAAPVPHATVSNEPASFMAGGAPMVVNGDVRIVDDARSRHESALAGAGDVQMAPTGEPLLGTQVTVVGGPGGDPMSVGGTEVAWRGVGRPRNIKG